MDHRSSVSFIGIVTIVLVDCEHRNHFLIEQVPLLGCNTRVGYIIYLSLGACDNTILCDLSDIIIYHYPKLMGKVLLLGYILIIDCITPAQSKFNLYMDITLLYVTQG